MAGTAGGADLADDRQDDVLAGHAFRQLAIDTHQHVLGLLLRQRLGSENMLDLGRADAMRQRTESAVGRGVAVAADDRHAGQGKALFGTNDMDDALADVALVIIFEAEILGVLGQRLDLDTAFLVLDAEMAIRRGRNVVVNDSQRLFRRAHLAAGQAQAFESLRRRHFVNQVAVDIEKTDAVLISGDDVVVPDLVIQGTGCAHGCHPFEQGIWEQRL